MQMILRETLLSPILLWEVLSIRRYSFHDQFLLLKVFIVKLKSLRGLCKTAVQKSRVSDTGCCGFV